MTESGEKYINGMFSNEGYQKLFRYTQNLVKEYFKRNAEDYPFRLGIVFGMPHFEGLNKQAMIFNNKDELSGRIQGYLQLLCISYIDVELSNDSVLRFELPDVEVKKDDIL